MPGGSRHGHLGGGDAGRQAARGQCHGQGDELAAVGETVQRSDPFSAVLLGNRVVWAAVTISDRTSRCWRTGSCRPCRAPSRCPFGDGRRGELIGMTRDLRRQRGDKGIDLVLGPVGDAVQSRNRPCDERVDRWIGLTCDDDLRTASGNDEGLRRDRTRQPARPGDCAQGIAEALPGPLVGSGCPGRGAQLPGQALAVSLGQHFVLPLPGEFAADVRVQEHGLLMSARVWRCQARIFFGWKSGGGTAGGGTALPGSPAAVQMTCSWCPPSDLAALAWSYLCDRRPAG